MKRLCIIGLLALAACSPKRELVDVLSGKDGAPGANGHSIVSQYQSASEVECSSGGSRLDMYLDLDDSLSASSADKYTNSVVVCNGSNGLNGQQGTPGAQGPTGVAGSVGPQGPPGSNGNNGAPGSPGSAGPTGPQGPAGPQGIQGPAGSSGATIKDYTSNSCTLIDGSSPAVYVKPNGQNIKVYSKMKSNGDCDDSFAEISSGESIWLGAKILGVWSGSSLRVITFN